MLERYGRNGGPIHREGCGVPQNGTPRDTFHLHRRPPPASMGYRRPPPDSTFDCSSTGSCSSSLHRLLVHRLLFNHPSPRAPVQTHLHGILFIHPSLIYCSSSPSRGRPVHPALHGVLFIQPNRLDRSGSCSSRGNTTGSCSSTPTGNCSSNPPHNAHCSSRASIDWLQLVAVAKESLDRVQLTAIDRSLGFSNP